MIPAILLVLSAAAYRVTTGLLIHSGASWLSNFAPVASIALCCAAYFPKRYKFSVPLITLFISDAVINFRYGAPLLDPQIFMRYFALCGRLRRVSFAESRIAEGAFAGFHCWVDIFLRDHERVFLVERSWLREESGRTHPSAHGGIASVQRNAELDVFSQFTH